MSLISLIEKATKLSSALAGAERIEHPLVVLETTVLPLNYTPTLAETLGVEPRHTESKSVALPLRYAPMTTPPFYSEERWGLYHMLIISRGSITLPYYHILQRKQAYCLLLRIQSIQPM